MPPVKSLRCAENKTNAMSNPVTDMIAPTTSSFRSGERAAHQAETVTAGSGWTRAAAFPLDEDAFPFAWEEADDLRLALPAAPERDAWDCVLRGIRDSIAQMVCFSFVTRLEIHSSLNG